MAEPKSVEECQRLLFTEGSGKFGPWCDQCETPGHKACYYFPIYGCRCAPKAVIADELEEVEPHELFQVTAQ